MNQMCVTTMIANNIIQMLNQIQEEYEKVKNKISEMDKAQDDILHEIELASFNACEGYKLAKKLQEVRMERRIHKDEFVKMQKLHDLMQSQMPKLNSKLKGIITESEQFDKTERHYHPKVIKNIKASYKSPKVNKTNIKFSSEQDKIEELLQQANGGLI